MVKQCVVCGKEFETQYHSTKACGDKCRAELKRTADRKWKKTAAYRQYRRLYRTSETYKINQTRYQNKRRNSEAYKLRRKARDRARRQSEAFKQQERIRRQSERFKQYTRQYRRKWRRTEAGRQSRIRYRCRSLQTLNLLRFFAVNAAITNTK